MKNIASTSSLALSRLELDFWRLYDLGIIAKALKPDNFALYLLQIASFDM